jgi:2'-5' RNA ligase
MMNMYFIALAAPQEINDNVLKWKQFMKDRFECTVALRSPAHITLIPPFWMEDVSENNLKNTINEFAIQQTSFEITLLGFDAFKPRVIYVNVLPNEALQKLQAQLQVFLIQTKLFPIKKEKRPFHPHVTIAARDLHKKAFREAWDIFQQKRYRADWIANSISLLKHNQKKWDVVFTSHFEN